jgi:hypothetical protein
MITSSYAASCNTPASYGELAELAWDGLPKPVGSKISLRCKKGSAFTTESLQLTGYNTSFWQMFGSINLTCGMDGKWWPLPDKAPTCQGTVCVHRPELGCDVQARLLFLLYYVCLKVMSLDVI